MVLADDNGKAVQRLTSDNVSTSTGTRIAIFARYLGIRKDAAYAAAPYAHEPRNTIVTLQPLPAEIYCFPRGEVGQEGM